MQSAEEGPIVMVKLSDGEDVLASLEAAAHTHKLENGAVLWGIGMLKDFEIGFFGSEGYERKTIPNPHELIHGSIAMNADPRFHLHVAVGQRDHSVVGGHLFRAKACVVNEICLERFGRIRLRRLPNPKTGLSELDVG